MKASDANLDEREVEELLKKVPLRLGQGKTQVSLFEAIPTYAIQDLVKIAKDYAKNL